jgi:hypothetical protein
LKLRREERAGNQARLFPLTYQAAMTRTYVTIVAMLVPAAAAAAPPMLLELLQVLAPPQDWYPPPELLLVLHPPVDCALYLDGVLVLTVVEATRWRP